MATATGDTIKGASIKISTSFLPLKSYKAKALDAGIVTNRVIRVTVNDSSMLYKRMLMELLVGLKKYSQPLSPNSLGKTKGQGQLLAKLQTRMTNKGTASKNAAA